MKFRLFAAFAVAAVVLSGCTPPPISIDYTPSSTLSATGAVQVDAFEYQPALDGKVKANQIANTALGQVMIDENIDVLYRDAVFDELRFVGVKVGTGDKHLTGSIRTFLIDDLGFSVDWTVDVDYIVKDGHGQIIYESDKVTKHTTAKFIGAIETLRTQIKDNIEMLIRDPAFIKAIN